MDETRRIVTQIVIDHSGLNTSTAEFERAMSKHKKAYEDAGGSALSFDRAQKQWQQSLAATDPVLRAQVRMMNEVEKQQRIGSEAVKLGITTQAAHEAQIERVRQKYQGYVNQAHEAVSANTLMGKATGLLTAQVGALAGALSVGALIAFGKAAFDNAAGLGEQAQQLTIGVEALQAYRAAFLTNGIAVEQGNVAIQKFSRNIGEARESVGTARTAFAQLGLSASDLGSTEGGLAKTAAALLGVRDANERARLETVLFGRSGMQMETVLESLADPIDVLIAKGKALGVVLSEDMATKADEASDRWSLAMKKLEVETAGPVTRAIEWLTRLLELRSRVAAEWEVTQSGKFGINPGYDTPGYAGAVEAAMKYNSPEASSSRYQSFVDAGGKSPKLVGNFADVGQNANTLSNLNPSDLDTATGWKLKGSGIYESQAQAQREREMAGLDPVRRAQIVAVEARAEQILKAQGEDQTVLITGYAQAKKIVDDAAASQGIWNSKQIESNAAVIAQAGAREKIKETFSGYLAQLGEEARLAGLTTEERKQQEAVIKAARIQQREDDPNIRERDLINNYAKGAEYLGQQKTQAVLLKETQIDINALAARFADDANRAVKDYRDAVAAIAAAGDMTPQQKRVANDNLLQPSRRFQIETGQANPFGPAAQSGVNAALEQNSADQRSALLQNDQYFKSGQYGEGVSAEKKFADMRLGILQGYAEKAGQIEMSLAQQRIALGEQVAGSVADAMGNMFGRQSAEYRVAFGIQKAFATAQAVLALNEAILNAMTVPWPANIPAVATAIGLGATIMSNIASVAMPGYATGVIGLDGPGTGTSDSIVARLSRGESVVTAAGTRGNESTLASINRGAKYDRSANDNGGMSQPIIVSPVFNMKIEGGDAKTAQKWREEAITVVKDGMAEAVKQIRREASDLYAVGAKHPRRRAS
jgi:hypothetical protein